MPMPQSNCIPFTSRTVVKQLPVFFTGILRSSSLPISAWYRVSGLLDPWASRIDFQALTKSLDTKILILNEMLDKEQFLLRDSHLWHAEILHTKSVLLSNLGLG